MYILTGMDIKHKYYTYMLVNPDTGAAFYVGKGTQKRFLDHFKEAITNNSTNQHKTNTIKKILNLNKEVVVEIVLSSDDERKCFLEEKRLIKLYGRKNNNTGCLTNVTDGGEGGSFPHTEEHKQSLREYNPGGIATSKSIHQICPKTGRVIRTWDSTRQAGMSLGIKCWRNISACANKHKGRVVGSYYWRWVGDSDVVNSVLVEYQSLNEFRKNNSNRASKLVKCYSLDGKFIEEFQSFSSAAKKHGVSVSCISLAVKQGKPAIGYVWSR